MKKVTIYSTTYCPYCVKAKNLLKQKGTEFEEINIETDSNLKDLMIEKTNGRKTVPQIFIGEKHIGGFDDLYALEIKGELDSLLNC